MGQQSSLGDLAGFLFRDAPRVDPHGWLGPLTASAPAVRAADGQAATAHVVLGETDRPARKRFHTEATRTRATLAGSSSPFVVRLLDHAVDDEGRPVLFTGPFGPSLAGELAARGPLSVDRTLAAAADAAAGLAALHEAGEPHRALSPRALLREPDERVRLTIPALPMLAELVAADDGTGHEPPEVLAGSDWTVAADVYAFASTLWTLLAGSTAGAPERLARQRPAMPRTDVPVAVLSALTEAMTADPAARPAGALELAAALTDHAGRSPVPPSRQETVSPDGPDIAEGRPLGSAYWLDDPPLGRGSTGTVYRARRRADGMEFAAKLLHPELAGDRRAVARFLGERDVLLRLDHPHLVKVHDLVVEGGEMAIVMDLVDGADLRQVVARASLARADGIRLLGQVAGALAAMHAAGIIHRDVKPENVLVTGSGPDATARLTDFGLAKMRDRPTITRRSALLGTLAYVAPELATDRPPTAACDVYSLGVTCYELLAGHRPFRADSELALLREHFSVPPRRPRDVSDREWALLSACLAKDPAARPAAGQVAEALATLTAPGAPFEPTASVRMPTQQVRLPSPAPETNPTGSTPTDADILQSTMDGTRAPLPDARVPAGTGRRWWPLVTATAATAVIGTAIGVWLAAGQQGGDGDDAGLPEYRSIPVEATFEADGAVRLRWSPGVEEQPGFQAYAILRGREPLDELSAGNSSYLDEDPGEAPCYTVIALGVPQPDSGPAPSASCPNR
ncbi:protein kinase domain-containing protein [Actinophytocola sp.]|uniref:protein kinase domain-containing protein n=1 Tax=Actinophytocola sp. TaxID=1872138 RepID=UPI003D6AB246